MSLWDCTVQHGANCDFMTVMILCLAVEDKYNNSNISENNESIK